MMTLRQKTTLLRTLFGRYLSEEVAAEIIAGSERQLKLGGEKREVTVLFGDLRGFTPLAERDLTRRTPLTILNVYLTHVIDIVFDTPRHSRQNFAETDCMAFFGAPDRSRRSLLQRRALCACALQERLKGVSFH